MRSPANSTQSKIVFSAKGLSKVYRMGEVSVHALRGVKTTEGEVFYRDHDLVKDGSRIRIEDNRQ